MKWLSVVVLTRIIIFSKAETAFAHSSHNAAKPRQFYESETYDEPCIPEYHIPENCHNDKLYTYLSGMLQKLYDHPNQAPDVLSFIKNLVVKMISWNRQKCKSFTMNFEPYSPNTIPNVFYQYANEPSSFQSVNVLGGQSGHSYDKSSHSFLKQYANLNQHNAQSSYSFSNAKPETDSFLNFHQAANHDRSYSYGKSSASQSHYAVNYNKHSLYRNPTIQPITQSQPIPEISYELSNCNYGEPQGFEYLYGQSAGHHIQSSWCGTHKVPTTSSFPTFPSITSNFHSTDYQLDDNPAFHDTFYPHLNTQYESFNSVPDVHYQSSAWHYGKQQTSSYHTKSPQTPYSYPASYEEPVRTFPQVSSNYHSSNYLQYDKPPVRDQFYPHLSEYPQSPNSMPETYYESIECNNYGNPQTLNCQYGHSTSPQMQSSYSMSYNEPISPHTFPQLFSNSQPTNCHKSPFQSQLFDAFPDMSYQSGDCNYGTQEKNKYSYMYDQSSNHQSHSSYSSSNSQSGSYQYYDKPSIRDEFYQYPYEYPEPYSSNSKMNYGSSYPHISTNFHSGSYQYYDKPSIRDEFYQYPYEYPESYSPDSKMNYGSSYPHISTNFHSGGYQYYDKPAIRDEFQQYAYEYPQSFSSTSKINYGSSKWSYGKSQSSSYKYSYEKPQVQPSYYVDYNEPNVNNWQIPQQLSSNSQFSLYDRTRTQDLLPPYPQHVPGFQNGLTNWMESNTQFSEFPFQYNTQGSQQKFPSYSELSMFDHGRQDTRLSLCSLDFKSIYNKIRSIIGQYPIWSDFLAPIERTVMKWFHSRPDWFQSSMKNLYSPLFDTQSYGSALLPKQYSHSDGNSTRSYFLKFMRHIVKQFVQCLLSKVTHAVGDGGFTGCTTYDTNSFPSSGGLFDYPSMSWSNMYARRGKE